MNARATEQQVADLREQRKRRKRRQSELMNKAFFESTKVMRVCVLIITACFVGAFIYLARPILLPLILATLLALVFQPLQRFLSRRLKLPSFLAALLIVLGLTGSVFAAGYFLAEPASRYSKEFAKEENKAKLRKMFSPIQEIHNDISDVAHQMDNMAAASSGDETKGSSNIDNPDDGEVAAGGVRIESKEDSTEVTTTIPKEGSPAAQKPLNVEIKDDPVTVLYTALQEFGFNVLATIVLMFFLLSSGNQLSASLSEGEGTSEFFRDIQKDVSGYLLTISLINAGLGVAVGFGLWLVDMPNPVLWGFMAAVLNFVPYAGALIGTGVVMLAAALVQPDLTSTLTVGAIYMGASAIEGNFVTPSVIGRRFEINPTVVFVWILAWGALWGLAGMLIGLPILMAVRITCSRFDSLAVFERIITASDTDDEENDKKSKQAAEDYDQELKEAVDEAKLSPA